MVELQNIARTESYGCFASMKVVKKQVGEMLNVGKLPPGHVLVCHYKSGVLLRAYPVVFSTGKNIA